MGFLVGLMAVLSCFLASISGMKDSEVRQPRLFLEATVEEEGRRVTTLYTCARPAADDLALNCVPIPEEDGSKVYATVNFYVAPQLEMRTENALTIGGLPAERALTLPRVGVEPKVLLVSVFKTHCPNKEYFREQVQQLVPHYLDAKASDHLLTFYCINDLAILRKKQEIPSGAFPTFVTTMERVVNSCSSFKTRLLPSSIRSFRMLQTKGINTMRFAVGFLLNKMIDPCAVMDDSGPPFIEGGFTQQEADRICDVYCKFLSQAATTLNTNARMCMNLKSGKCDGKDRACACMPEAPLWAGRKGFLRRDIPIVTPVLMLQCNNIIRIK